MVFKKVICIFMSLISVFLTGCWDKVEIDDRAFVLAMVVSTPEKGKVETSVKTENKAEASNLLKASFYIPIPSKLLSGKVDTFSVEQSEGVNLPMAVENLDMKFSRQMFFGETKVILIAEDALKDSEILKKLLDFVEREPDMGREAQIAVLKGETKKLEAIKPKFEKVFAAYMIGIFNNSARISAKLALSINDFLGEIRQNKGSAVLPVAEVEEDKVSVKQLALIKDYKLLNYMDVKYLKPYSIITNTLKDGDIAVPFKNDNISLKVASCSRKISVESADDKLQYKIAVKIEGDIDNYITDEEIFDDKSINLIKDAIKEYVKNELDTTTAYFQKDLGYDYLGLGDYTKKYHNKLYKKYENNWDEGFKKSKIDYDVQIFIRRLGGARK